MKVNHPIVRADDGAVDPIGIEVEDLCLVVIDPDDGVKVRLHAGLLGREPLQRGLVLKDDRAAGRSQLDDAIPRELRQGARDGLDRKTET
jgi:hypothetical protein